MKTWARLLMIGLLAICVLAGARAGRAEAPDWTVKVATAVLTEARTRQPVDVLVVLREQADLHAIAHLPDKAAKTTAVFEQLTAVANRTQPDLIRQLDRAGAAYQPFWITNMIAVRADAALLQQLARRPDVARIAANRPARADQPEPDPTVAPQTVQALPWGLTRTNADDVWALGYTGQGVVVGGQDTGYEWDHPALQDQYRGWDGTNATHAYNWHDAIHAIDSHNSGTNPCGLDSAVPCDDHNHGTHTMGTMIGTDATGAEIGMAPDATWIGCRNMERGWGTPATYAECFQWFIAPTDLNGANPDPTKAPHVIANSWSCPTSEGCTDPAILQTIVENTRTAGIVVVVSAGNSGPSCSSVSTPAAIYDASFSVGATSSSDTIASFSSRGPVTVDGSQRFKPDISAPGVGVYSSVRNGGYSSMSGTSMAGPHVAGLVALLISADPSLAGQVDRIEMLVRNTAVPLTTTDTCGGVPAGTSPNQTFGYGRIDALAAVNAALNPPAAVAPDLSIAGDAASAALTWPVERANCELIAYRHTTPYFTTVNATLLGTVWADVVSLADATAVAPGSALFYRVTAVNCAGSSMAESGEVGRVAFGIVPGS